MFKDIIIGQYIPKASPLHSMDAMMKIILTVAYAAVLFAINRPVPYLIFALFTALVICLSRIPPKVVMRGLRPLKWIILFTAAVNIFMLDGNILGSAQIFGITLKITDAGLKTAILITVRLIFLVSGTSLLTLTTPPLSLTYGIERLLAPLGKIKAPIRETAMMMSIAIRFIPIVAEEADKIRKAQLSRGAQIDSGNIIKRALAMSAVIIPLFAGAFRRADELSEAMDSRCYSSANRRTRMREEKITKTDIVAALIFAAVAAIVLITEFAIEF